jgi:Zn-dependent protease with chaperone function
MYCDKCGREMPEGSRFCNSCGTQASSGGTSYGRAANVLEPLVAQIKRDPVVALVSVGSLMLVLGPLLAWVSARFGAATLGLQMPSGAAVLAAGVLLLVTLVLSRTGMPGAWGIVTMLISGLALVLVFQSMYWINDQAVDLTIREGVYVSMVGALLTAVGGGLEYYYSSKS